MKMTKKTITITVVLDARRDMYEAGYGPEHDVPFEAAYRDAARNLQTAVNRRLGGHRLSIWVVAGNYDGPAMQRDSQPTMADGEHLWQHLHNHTLLRDGHWGAAAPNDGLVDELRRWVLDRVREVPS